MRQRALVLVLADGAVDLAHEPVARVEAERAGEYKEEAADDRAVP